MILYLDTSALVKVFVAEEHTPAVRAAVQTAEAVVVSHVTFVEAHAAFARMHSGGRLTDEQHERIAAAFDELWADLVVVAISDRLVVRGAALARRYGLRGYDALQLACALELGGPTPTCLACFDVELTAAGVSEGLVPLAR